MQIEVTNEISEPRKAGNNEVREQMIWVHRKGNKYPERSSLSLWANNDPVKAGNYNVDLDAAIFVGKFNRLTLSIKPEHLVPVPVKAAS